MSQQVKKMSTERLKTAVERLKEELAAVRKSSLAACARGDFMKMAKLTARAHEINKQIFEALDIIDSE